jgi:SAM-dependent methyltransferase
MKETTKAITRRLHDARFVSTYFKGSGIDIGAGADSLGNYIQQFPLISFLRPWDVHDGDGSRLDSIPDQTYDFVYSSHCLEHLSDPYQAYQNWIRVCKPGGHIIVTMPDEDLYEQGKYPSVFTTEHRTSWTIAKQQSWCPTSINVFDFLNSFRSQIEVLKVELINGMYMYNSRRFDQTSEGNSECAIEMIVRRRTQSEIDQKGRYPQ